MQRRRRTAQLAAATLLTVGAVVAGVVMPSAASAVVAPLSPTDQSVHDLLDVRSGARDLGGDLSGLVTDAETGQVVWAGSETERQLPASTVKLLTAATALETFGPDARFTTRAMTGATARRVVLVGGGDPSLTRAHLRRLARVTAADVLAKGLRKVRVDVDDSLFPAPTRAVGWSRSTMIRDVSAVRALVVDQHRRWDTSIDAGNVFATLLKRQGVKVAAVTRRARPATSTVIAQVTGDDLATQVAYMLRTSDNDVAEVLHRMVAVQNGLPATWQGAAEAQVAVLARLGVTIRPGSVHDGSGLSRSDRLTPAEVVAVLATAYGPAHPNLASLQTGSLAVAGLTGTLGPTYKRYRTGPTRCAQGLIEAKTGSLSGVIALSGRAVGADGRVKLFSFLLNRVPSTLTTRRAVDKLATTVTGCW
jgi:D-alanyl-D-alanine carboxypeptidase/D-alanyl-D-alanine-endopeptidase (penicillin-binding protein 4)